MRWFGESWGAPVCESNAHARTPIGERCMHCGIVIVEGDQGLLIPHIGHGVSGAAERPHHLDCFLDQLGVLSAVRHMPPPDPQLPETKDGGIPRRSG